MPNVFDMATKWAKSARKYEDTQLLSEADLYRAALQKATYGALGPEFTQGLSAIQNYLAGAGPLADSGAATALRSRLASGIYGRAAGQIGQGYASFLADLLRRRQEQRYRLQYAKYMKKLQGGGGVGGAVGRIAGAGVGFLAGGPAGAAAGYGIGGGIGGGGYGGGYTYEPNYIG